MRFVQDQAKNLVKIGDNLKTISENGCCAFCVLWYFDVDIYNDDAILLINDAIKDKVLKPDCTVLWKEFAHWLTGRDIDVEFRDIKSLKEIEGRAIVKFVNGNYEHWVGVEDGKIVFNSQAHSLCVQKGQPVTARIITIKKGN